MFQFVRLEASGAVAFLRLNRPPVNALDELALSELASAVAQIESNAAVRVVVIASAIAGTFCAGGDLKYWPRQYAHAAGAVSDAGQRTFAALEHLTRPSIAAIQGAVIGDGLSLALACDLRLASHDASFQLPEVRYGFIPGWGTIGRLIAAAGSTAASELLLVGEPIDAARAQALGLVNRVLPSPALLPEAERLAAQIALQPPLALRHAKAALHGGSAAPSPEQRAWEAHCFAEVWGGSEWEEGLRRAFKGRST
jgi:enoyl-CoA hydratase